MRRAMLFALGIFSSVACAAPDTVFIDGFEQSLAFDVALTPNTVIGPAVNLISNVAVPPGAYVALVRMQVITGSTAPGNSFRLDCTLSPGFDSGVYRIGMQTNAERYVTFQGAATLAGAGNIQFSCRDGNGNSSTLLSGKLTVMSVGSVN